MTGIEVDWAAVGAAGDEVRGAGAEVSDSWTRLTSLITEAGAAAGAASVAAAADSCARNLGQRSRLAGRAGVALGEQVRRSAADYAAVERRNAGGMTSEPAS